MRKHPESVLVILLPLLFVVAGFSFLRITYSNDPEYIYLLNALNITQLKAVGNAEHPGTTAMEFGAVFLAVSHWLDLRQRDTLASSVLKDPDRFVGRLLYGFIALNGLVLFVVGWLVFRRTGNPWAAILFQLPPFLSDNCLEHTWTKVSPEQLLLSTSTLMAGLLVLFHFDERKNRSAYLVLFSFLSGFGLATKWTFLPLVFIPFVILPGLKRRLFYGAGVFASFALFTLPALPEYGNMMRWCYGILTHKGIYGQGARGLVDLSSFAINVKNIFFQNLIFSLVFCLVTLTTLVTCLAPQFRERRREAGIPRILIALVAAQVVGGIMAAKHYRAHYLLPLICLSGAALFFAFHRAKTIFGRRVDDRLILGILTAAGVFLASAWNLPVMLEKYEKYRMINQELNETFQRIDNYYPEYTRVYYYPTSINRFSALKLGNAYSKNRHLLSLKTLYPETYFYDTRTGLFYRWEAETLLEDLVRKHGDDLVLIGGPLSDQIRKQIIEAGFPLKPVYCGRTQAVFLLDKAAVHFESESSRSTILDVTCDAETRSADGDSFEARNHLFAGGSAQTTERSHSFHHAVKLHPARPFAFDFMIRDLRAGDQLKISVWRYGNGFDGALVAAADPVELFYRHAYDFVDAEISGWKLLNLHVTVPEVLQGKELKVYVWNSGRSAVYFDDLRIQMTRRDRQEGSRQVAAVGS